jgi:hypothetical protein
LPRTASTALKHEIRTNGERCEVMKGVRLWRA